MTFLLKMNSNALFFRPLRFFTRSSFLGKKNEDEGRLSITDKVDLPVETDTHKLANYVCGTNLLVEGGEDIKLKPDSEYPEWLWSICPPPPMEELDKNSKQYWNRIRKQRIKEQKYLKTLERNRTVHK